MEASLCFCQASCREASSKVKERKSWISILETGTLPMEFPVGMTGSDLYYPTGPLSLSGLWPMVWNPCLKDQWLYSFCNCRTHDSQELGGISWMLLGTKLSRSKRPCSSGYVLLLFWTKLYDTNFKSSFLN